MVSIFPQGTPAQVVSSSLLVGCGGAADYNRFGKTYETDLTDSRLISFRVALMLVLAIQGIFLFRMQRRVYPYTSS